MKILVTGGAGYVGNLLAKALLGAGHVVTIFDNFMFGYDSVLHIVNHPNLHIIKGDIRNDNLAYLHDKDVIFHLAAISGYPACEANPNSAKLINVDATVRISDYLAKDQLLIYASTTSFYGNSGSVSDEKTIVNPVSLYGLTKHQAEQIILQRENAISLRWATVFGVSPRMRAGLLVNDFVQKAVQEGTLVLYSPYSKRTFMHVADSVKGYLFALDHAHQMRGQIYNMGSEKLNFSKREIADAIKQYFSFEIIEANMLDKDVRHFSVSFANARALGFNCEVSLEDGIHEMIKLYRFYTPHSFIKPI
ncbi:NAD(P)-dependent oxidoreductase [candidate division KSB1 bacterium]|nr:MAG: NAD(P)-dependent oxidoreductase [candidate division KSB1 bacterium]MBC6946584.1 NAD(P)-dependent oxidoreductase [candidate division KSB1 bacterium]MCE7940179.1 NAD(P)-dependent oxidoreductase [Chlorobi bacterium CHB1]MDL1873848.1 NAD(P)-dependent oxidoreductase [Cytophagia bacterium CHB2]